ncbi:MAG: 50S ribosomal protein L23 [Clostridiales bacterium]|jgi:large subunit ribosomal protein L23|nr:50S ribosomal protein L23 [Clostridiales bacterium]
MTSSYDIIIKPVLTEKSYDNIPVKRYCFIVDKRASKDEIKLAIEEIFGVKVEKINTANQLGKMKRQGRTQGRRPSTKKAYVQLKESSKGIDFFDSLSQ